MSDKMRRFQRLLNEAPSLQADFALAWDEIDIVADALNYIGLSLSEGSFIRMLCATRIYVECRSVDAYCEKRVIAATTTIKHDSIEHPTFGIGFNRPTNYEISRVTLNTELQMPDRKIVIGVSADQTEPSMHRIVNIACTRSNLYTVAKSGLTLPALDHEQALKCLKDDIEEGITKYLETYIMNNKEEINGILEICNKNQWNELTMTILRICHDENIQIPSVKISL